MTFQDKIEDIKCTHLIAIQEIEKVVKEKLTTQDCFDQFTQKQAIQVIQQLTNQAVWEIKNQAELVIQEITN